MLPRGTQIKDNTNQKWTEALGLDHAAQSPATICADGRHFPLAARPHPDLIRVVAAFLVEMRFNAIGPASRMLVGPQNPSRHFSGIKNHDCGGLLSRHVERGGGCRRCATNNNHLRGTGKSSRSQRLLLDRRHRSSYRTATPWS